MIQPAKAQEPSMEDILASIRRIIADDDVAKPQPPASSKPPEPSPAKASPPVPPGLTGEEAREPHDLDTMLSARDEAGEPNALASAGDVFELTEAMTAGRSEPKPGGIRKIEVPRNGFDEPSPRPPSPMRPGKTGLAHSLPPDGSEPLLSTAATAAVNSAFSTLAHTVLVQNARTLEDLVKEMLRPLLKTWLDDNLPSLVERLVRAEIERVSRGLPG